jgi:hypothetical protein
MQSFSTLMQVVYIVTAGFLRVKISSCFPMAVATSVPTAAHNRGTGT